MAVVVMYLLVGFSWASVSSYRTLILGFTLQERKHKLSLCKSKKNQTAKPRREKWKLIRICRLCSVNTNLSIYININIYRDVIKQKSLNIYYIDISYIKLNIGLSSHWLDCKKTWNHTVINHLNLQIIPTNFGYMIWTLKISYESWGNTFSASLRFLMIFDPGTWDAATDV